MQLNHYLNFQGETEAAFNFYKSVFGGEFSHIQHYGDMPQEEGVHFTEQEKKYILHVSLPINEFTVLMASDIHAAYCNPNSPPFNQGNNHYISINLTYHEVEQATHLFNALSINGDIEMPLEKTFWGALYGAFTDQFGIKWMINCELPPN